LILPSLASNIPIDNISAGLLRSAEKIHNEIHKHSIHLSTNFSQNVAQLPFRRGVKSKDFGAGSRNFRVKSKDFGAKSKDGEQDWFYITPEKILPNIVRFQKMGKIPLL
jgi:hypothetical protein